MIAKADILTFINDVLKRSETAAQVAVPIQTVLNDLSNYDFLTETDTGQSLADGGLTLNYPTDFKGLVSIVLIDSSSVRQAPLKPLPGGHKEYRELRDNDSTTGEPEWYSEFDEKFWLWRPAGGTYTTEIEHYRFHPQDVDTILFGDEFRNAIYFGAAYFVALKYGLSRYIDIWGSLYEREKEMRRLNIWEQPHIIRG